MRNTIITAVILLLVLAAGGYGLYHTGYERGHDLGYKSGYDAGYGNGYADRNKLAEQQIADAVTANTKTETKIVYQKVPYNGNDVQISTPPPTVTVSVNGKKQDIVQHQETADLAVKTETAVKIKVPERRWSVGIGTDGRKVAYMIKAPVKGAIGAWVAGSGRDKIMGGLSISW